jgi:hypothetical protein
VRGGGDAGRWAPVRHAWSATTDGMAVNIGSGGDLRARGGAGNPLPAPPQSEGVAEA